MAYIPVEERRRQFLDAAVEVIAAEGLARLTTRRIADAANAPLGALHYCFRNKDEIIELVCDRAAEALQAWLSDVDTSLGLEATLRDSIQAFWSWVRSNPGLQLATIEILMWSIRSEDHDGLDKIWDPYGGQLLRERLGAAARSDDVRPAISVDEMVRFIVHRFDGLVFEYAATGDEAGCARQTELLADALVSLALPVPGRRPLPNRRRSSQPTYPSDVEAGLAS